MVETPALRTAGEQLGSAGAVGLSALTLVMIGRRGHPPLRRAVSLVARSFDWTFLPIWAAVLFCLSSPARADRRSRVAPTRNGDHEAARLAPPGKPLPPPRFPGALSEVVRPKGVAVAIHPAIHGRGSAKSEARLFPRVVDRQQREREEAMRRHPSGRRKCRDLQHRVERGDTLWSIAERQVDTPDLAQIASRTHAIYRANRDRLVHPDILHPGQTLRLPGRCDR